MAARRLQAPLQSEASNVRALITGSAVLRQVGQYARECAECYRRHEPEIYAGNFRLEIRYGKNGEYEMLTEQVVAESTDGKYYFVMPEADCGKKVQVRVTGLGPDGDETEAVESKAKKLKC